jgi:hypothetical protein
VSRSPAAALRFLLLLVIPFLPNCSRLQTLTPETLQAARQKWQTSRPGYYRLLVEMRGDRVESGLFEVTVQGEEVVSLRRNGQVILPGRGQDYSMEGLFRVLIQEIDLASKPTLLGAPEGYAVYPMARFDEQTGRLIHYRRTVGGAKNSIDIDVRDFEVLQH